LGVVQDRGWRRTTGDPSTILQLGDQVNILQLDDIAVCALDAEILVPDDDHV
jgi:hypothetical protein